MRHLTPPPQLHRCFYLTLVATLVMTSQTNVFCNGYISSIRYSTNHQSRKLSTVFNPSVLVPANVIDTRQYLSVCEESSTISTPPNPIDLTTVQLKGIARSISSLLLITTFLLTSFLHQALPANAAPPFAVIAEELGYYPIMVPSSSSSSSGSQSSTVQYVAKRVQRPSTQQAIDLAHYMRTVPDHQIVLAGTYWCSHTSHQKELFGIEAWNELNTKEPSTKPSSTNNNKRGGGTGRVPSKSGFTYVECAPQGYRSNPTICSNLKVDGYPTWIITTKSDGANSKPNTVRLSGERSLYDIANAVGYTNIFDASIEDATNPPTGSSACK